MRIAKTSGAKTSGAEPRSSKWALLGATAVCVLALSGCGSGSTKTASVSSIATPQTITQPTRTTGTTPSPSPSTAPTPTTTSTTGSGPVESTRTTTAPAFTKEGARTEGLSGALAVVKAHGYSASDGADYRPSQTLRVLVGTRAGSRDGRGQRAFFFVGNHYIGTDASESSATIKLLSQSDTEVTLAYPLYRPHDPPCCSSGGQRVVRFQLNNGRLVALGQIPSTGSSSK